MSGFVKLLLMQSYGLLMSAVSKVSIKNKMWIVTSSTIFESLG